MATPRFCLDESRFNKKCTWQTEQIYTCSLNVYTIYGCNCLSGTVTEIFGLSEMRRLEMLELTVIPNREAAHFGRYVKLYLQKKKKFWLHHGISNGHSS